MRERPITFTDPEIRAWLAGKTQFRRLVKLREFQPSTTPGYDWTFRDRRGLWNDVGHDRLLRLCPHGVIGDRLYVKETWCRAGDDAICEEDPQSTDGRPRGPIVEHLERPVWAYYRATDPDVVNVLDEGRSPWKSPILMPRWASRITLEIAEVRVQRVQEISPADVLAEGITEEDARCDGECGVTPCSLLVPTYGRLWDSINGKRRHRGELIRLGESGYGRRQFHTVLDESARWEANPWVWAVTAKRVETT